MKKAQKPSGRMKANMLKTCENKGPKEPGKLWHVLSVRKPE